jgi:hypothetical protein
MEKIKAWEAHMDYIRYVEVHPTLPHVLRWGPISAPLLARLDIDISGNLFHWWRMGDRSD